MNRKMIIIALVISMVVTAIVWQQLERPTIVAPVKIVPVETKNVVVAKRRISTRTRLEFPMIDDVLEIKPVNASDVPETAFFTIASLSNKYTSMPILPGDIMTPDRVLDKDAVPSLAFAVPAGKRAVTIQSNAIIGVAGFVQQGDFVDVIATFRPAGGDIITKVVLQDIQVLAVGKTYFQDVGAGGTASPSAAITSQLTELITVAVTPEDLEKLVFLDSGVQFRLVLKSPIDKGASQYTRGATQKIVMEQVSAEQKEFEKIVGIVPDAGPEVEPPEVPPTTVVTEPTPTITIAQQPVDDGRVEIYYGRKIVEEIFKDGYEVPPSYGNSGAQRGKSPPTQQQAAPPRPSSIDEEIFEGGE